MICLTKLFQQKRRRIGYILAFSDPTISKRDSSDQQNRISKANLIEVEVDLLKVKNAIQNRKALQDAQNNLTLLLNDSSNLIVAFSENDFPSFFQSFDKEKILENVLKYNVDLVKKVRVYLNR